jgi:hypothetical protein
MSLNGGFLCAVVDQQNFLIGNSLVGDEPLRAFARRAGMSDTGLKRYMFDGSEHRRVS